MQRKMARARGKSLVSPLQRWKGSRAWYEVCITEADMICASTKTARPRVSNGRLLHTDHSWPVLRIVSLNRTRRVGLGISGFSHIFPSNQTAPTRLRIEGRRHCRLWAHCNFLSASFLQGGEGVKGGREGDWERAERARARKRSSRARPPAASFKLLVSLPPSATRDCFLVVVSRNLCA